MQLPRGQWPCLLLDPPWHHVSYSLAGQARSPSSHYATMSLDQIKAMPVGNLAADDSHLFMWTTQPHLEQAFEVLDAYGFKFSSVFKFWIKTKEGITFPRSQQDLTQGMGFTTRKNVEIVLLGRRGSPQRLRNDISDLLFAPRREHSRKPDAIFRVIEEYCPGPRLELFSRESRQGWTTWGHETTKFDVAGGTVDASVEGV